METSFTRHFVFLFTRHFVFHFYKEKKSEQKWHNFQRPTITHHYMSALTLFRSSAMLLLLTVVY
jgi:hypothetical protein